MSFQITTKDQAEFANVLATAITAALATMNKNDDVPVAPPVSDAIPPVKNLSSKKGSKGKQNPLHNSKNRVVARNQMLRLLIKNPDVAYTVKEVSEEIEWKLCFVYSFLKRLKIGEDCYCFKDGNKKRYISVQGVRNVSWKIKAILEERRGELWTDETLTNRLDQFPELVKLGLSLLKEGIDCQVKRVKEEGEVEYYYYAV